jgi:hypothetical protein
VLAATPIMVNDGIAGDAIEPGLEPIRIGQPIQALEGLEQDILENILGDVIVANPLLNEALQVSLVGFPNHIKCDHVFCPERLAEVFKATVLC